MLTSALFLFGQSLGVKPGRPVSVYTDYMTGVSNELAESHASSILPRNDTMAGGKAVLSFFSWGQGQLNAVCVSHKVCASQCRSSREARRYGRNTDIDAQGGLAACCASMA